LRSSLPIRVLVSGEIERGKTGTCQEAARLLRERGWKVAGLLSPGIWKGGEKIGIKALDLHSRQSRILAQRFDQDEELIGVQTRRWRFDPAIIEWCNSILRDATPCDLLVVDEFGPLELVRGEGLIDGLPVVDAGHFRLGLMVVRSHLLPIAQERWPAAHTLMIHHPEEIPKRVDEILEHSVRIDRSTLIPG
jgi:hypothetical protein